MEIYNMATKKPATPTPKGNDDRSNSKNPNNDSKKASDTNRSVQIQKGKNTKKN
jgi:hypothetical protein